jgi:hypothetical protein
MPGWLSSTRASTSAPEPAHASRKAGPVALRGPGASPACAASVGSKVGFALIASVQSKRSLGSQGRCASATGEAAVELCQPFATRRARRLIGSSTNRYDAQP